jgi:hypothetical protein
LIKAGKRRMHDTSGSPEEWISLGPCYTRSTPSSDLAINSYSSVTNMANRYVFVRIRIRRIFVSPKTKRIIRDEYVNTRIRSYSYSSKTNIRRFYSFRFAIQPNLQWMRIFVWMRLYLARIERFDKVAKPLITLKYSIKSIFEPSWCVSHTTLVQSPNNSLLGQQYMEAMR